LIRMDVDDGMAEVFAGFKANNASVSSVGPTELNAPVA
jgi:hypothetical protein